MLSDQDGIVRGRTQPISPRRAARWYVLAILLLLMACSQPIQAQLPAIDPPPLTPRPGPRQAIPATPLPTVLPTVTTTSTATLPTSGLFRLRPTATPTAMVTATVAPAIATPLLMPTQSIAPTPALILLPTPTPWPTPSPTPPIDATRLAAEGSFFSQTTFPDGTVTQQQGSFTIVRVLVDHVFGADQQITLATRRDSGLAETITVYQVGDYIAVNYAAGDWVVLSREQGSGIVKAIQPITDLATAFPSIMDQATLIGAEAVAGNPTLRYRLDDAERFGPLLIQPLLATSGDIRSLQLDAWLDAQTGVVVRYSFQMEIAGARVFDTAFNTVFADQAVTWTYQVLTPEAAPGNAGPIAWPADAPSPDRVAVAGFAPGAFPLPTGNRLLSIIAGTPEWTVPAPIDEVSDFYRRVLTAQGWTVDGSTGYLQATKQTDAIYILLADSSEKSVGEGEGPQTRISVLDAP